VAEIADAEVCSGFEVKAVQSSAFQRVVGVEVRGMASLSERGAFSSAK